MRSMPVIAPRFNGPPASGHGGYSAGCAAVLVDAPVVEATLSSARSTASSTPSGGGRRSVTSATGPSTSAATHPAE